MLTRYPQVWDIAARTIKHIFTGHEQDIYSLDFAGNGRYIASGSGDKTVRLWDILDGKLVYTLSIEDGVTTVAMSPDGHYVAAGSLDKSVRVWDTTTGYLVERLESPDGHKDSVYSVAFAPNGRDLVSGSLDKTIKLWELNVPRGAYPGAGVKGGKCIRTFEGHKVCFFPLNYIDLDGVDLTYLCLIGLRPQCLPDPRWTLGHEWFQGSRCPILGSHHWKRADDAPGPQELGYVPPRVVDISVQNSNMSAVISVAPSPTNNLFATGSGDMRARIWRYVFFRLVFSQLDVDCLLTTFSKDILRTLGGDLIDLGSSGAHVSLFFVFLFHLLRSNLPFWGWSGPLWTTSSRAAPTIHDDHRVLRVKNDENQKSLVWIVVIVSSFHLGSLTFMLWLLSCREIDSSRTDGLNAFPSPSRRNPHLAVVGICM